MKSNIDHAFTSTNLHSSLEEPTYSGVPSFFRRKYTKDLSGVDVAISGVPLDLAVTHRPGTRFGPGAIRAASSIPAFFDIQWPWTFNPFEILAVSDYGDCNFDPGRPETVTDSIYKHAKNIIEAKVFMLTLGGDHYISYPLIKAHVEAHGPLSLIHFDAHSDTWAEDEKRIDHGSMFYHAAKEGLILPESSVQVGLRTHNDDTHGFNIINADEAINCSAEEITNQIKEIVGSNKVYLTFDIDCLDPAYAPGTGTPVIGGLTSHKALKIIRGLVGINLVGIDVVEVSPPYDVSEITALAAATIAYELLCLYAERKKS
jgi:agmatinase